MTRLPELEEACSECGGTGEVCAPPDDDVEEQATCCLDCSGRGYVLTAAGEQFVVFLKRWRHG